MVRKQANESLESLLKFVDEIQSLLKFIDEIPDPPTRGEIPFPYETSKPRPYGWFSDPDLLQDNQP